MPTSIHLLSCEISIRPLENWDLFAFLKWTKQISDLQKKISLWALLSEVKKNGFGKDLIVGKGAKKQYRKEKHFKYLDVFQRDSLSKLNRIPLMATVNEKMGHERPKEMGSPLSRAEMLSLVLYTGCDANYSLCKSQRKGDFDTWRCFDDNLMMAITKLFIRGYPKCNWKRKK